MFEDLLQLVDSVNKKIPGIPKLNTISTRRPVIAHCVGSISCCCCMLMFAAFGLLLVNEIYCHQFKNCSLRVR